MIKNKVNPVAVEGARSCEGAVGDGGVEMEENGWRRRQDTVCSSLWSREM